MKNSNTHSLVASAINLFDPAACMQIDYEAQVASLTEAVESLQQQDSQAAMALDPHTLSEVLIRASGTQRDVIEVLSEFVTERALAA